MNASAKIDFTLRAIFASMLFAFVTQFAYAQSAQPLITQTIDANQRVELKGNVHPQATAQNDRGRVSDNLRLEHMQLLLRRSPEQEAALQRTIDALHDPKSPIFHQWLTAQNFGLQYGLASADIQTIKTWLTAQGFTVNTVYPNGMLIDFSGTAGQVRNAFATEVHYLVANGARHIANMSNPQIPAALAPAVQGIVSLNDFRPHSMLKRAPKRATAQFTISSDTQFVAPADLATIYNFTSVFAGGNTGQGQTIALVEDTDIYSAKDWTAFRNAFGLSGYSAGTLLQLHPGVPGTANCADPGINSADIEAMVDAEWASAAAPSAKIELLSCADSNVTFGGLIALQNLLATSTPLPQIVSMSYGECEAGLGSAGNAAYSTTFQQLVAQGVSVFVSAGDEGAASCDSGNNGAYNGIAVSGFASTPYNVAVGGTDFSDTAHTTNSTYWSSSNSSTYESALSYIPEIPWNNSCASGIFLQSNGLNIASGSGGFCNTIGALEFALDNTIAGSGGPSNCATGSPTTNSSGLVSGAGSCHGTAKPSWQNGVAGLPSDGVRDLPDVSLFASSGSTGSAFVWGHAYVMCYSDVANGGAACTGSPQNWTFLGGTSVSSPIMAGVQALINNKAGGAQGNPNYVYYQLAAAQSSSQYGSSGASCDSSKGNGVTSSCIFYDVTQGDNVVPCFGYNCYGYTGTVQSNGQITNFAFGTLSTSSSLNSSAYAAQPGWDFATGIGTVNVANLIAAWHSP